MLQTLELFDEERSSFEARLVAEGWTICRTPSAPSFTVKDDLGGVVELAYTDDDLCLMAWNDWSLYRRRHARLGKKIIQLHQTMFNR